MAYDEILYEVANGVATITLNRPDKLNAWTFKMERELRDAFEAAGHASEVRVIVLTGAGRGFCAGLDSSALDTATDDPKSVLVGDDHVKDEFGAPHPDYLGRYAYFPSIPKPVVAAINGSAVGIGLIMALVADIRLASDQAKFGAPFARLGLIAEHGISWLLPRLIGTSNAFHMLYTAQMVNSTDALRMNLVTQVYPGAEFQAKVAEYAKHLATNVSPRALRLMKRQVYSDLYRSLDEATMIADKEMRDCLDSQDFREGVRHFLEKRPPQFTGR